jgi:DNA uptake protein ComE-like DNA-binding protein
MSHSPHLCSLVCRIPLRWFSIACFLILGLACPSIVTLAADRTSPQIDLQLQRPPDIPLERMERPLRTPAGPIKPVDLNKSSIEQLVALPGMNVTLAQQIIEGRPYHSKTDLIHKHLLSDNEYDPIKNLIAVE